MYNTTALPNYPNKNLQWSNYFLNYFCQSSNTEYLDQKVKLRYLNRTIVIYLIHYIVLMYLSATIYTPYITAATISFEQQTYIIYESDELVQPVLVLSNPSSSVITVQVFSTDGSATGKLLTISCTIIE